MEGLLREGSELIKERPDAEVLDAGPRLAYPVTELGHRASSTTVAAAQRLDCCTPPDKRCSGGAQGMNIGPGLSSAVSWPTSKSGPILVRPLRRGSCRSWEQNSPFTS